MFFSQHSSYHFQWSHTSHNHLGKHNNKAPGPGGYPAEFYEDLCILLASLFFRMVTQIKENHLTPYLNTASISLLKPGKDPTVPSSYCAISLKNVVLKIICKILAKRLESVIPDIIHPDQKGFIKGQLSVINTCRLIDVIDSSIINNLEANIVFWDAEKASDIVNWKFLIAVLWKFGFGNSFTDWIYTPYQVKHWDNDQFSPNFNLCTCQRGTEALVERALDPLHCLQSSLNH